jgi:tetratricopeptide (TPR) repeat protein
MAQENSEQNPAKAAAFFASANEAAEKNSFDYAIDMYLEGLRYEPDALEEGHIKLRELAVVRQEKGGEKPTMMEKIKHRGGKTALEQMLNAEYLFAKDPGHLPFAEAMLKAATAGGYGKTVRWIADFVFQENNAKAAPSFSTYVLLKDSYASIGLFDRAVAACQRAVKLRPKDGELADEYRRLSAELTLARGHYDQEGDFRQSIKDREAQEKLHAQQGVVKTEDYRLSAVEEARAKLARNPNMLGNIFGLAQVLSELENDEAENEAIELLEDAYERKSDFSFKRRAGQIKIKQLNRKLRKAKAAAEAAAGISPGKAEAARLNKERLLAELNIFELEHYRLCVENYPTDLQAKYEYGIRLVRSKRYDDAIPLFQEAQKDPRRKIAAMNEIGWCFFMKGWYADAIDVFSRAIEAYEIKDDNVAKELQYNLGRAYEEQNETEKALEIYRKIAQLDFAYKDVSQRVDKLRGKNA